MQPSHCSYFDCGVNDLQQNHLSVSLVGSLAPPGCNQREYSPTVQPIHA